MLFAIFLQSCNSDECVNCFTPPRSFLFEILDKNSGENLFTNGTFTADEIQITNISDDSPIEFTFISENGQNIIELNSIGWKTEIVDLNIKIANNTIFDFYVDAKRLKGECCDYTEFKEIIISGTAFEVDDTTGIYRILVE